MSPRYLFLKISAKIFFIVCSCVLRKTYSFRVVRFVFPLLVPLTYLLFVKVGRFPAGVTMLPLFTVCKWVRSVARWNPYRVDSCCECYRCKVIVCVCFSRSIRDHPVNSTSSSHWSNPISAPANTH